MTSLNSCRAASAETRPTLGSLRSRLSLTCLSFAACALSAAPSRAQGVKLSQVYGAGGNTFAPLLSDYIEIHNAGPAAQDLTGWSVQYASSTGVFSAVNTTTLPAITLASGEYLLVQEAGGTTLVAGQVPDLPPPQATGTIAMSTTDFKVALVSSTTFLPTGTPTYAGNPTLVDFVGAGTLADWNDTAAAGGAFAAANNAPPPSTAHAIYRIGCGATDTNSSRDDWAVAFPAPRNTTTAPNLGITAVGSALPLTLEAGQSARLTTTPYRCATNDLGASTTVVVDLSSIGGGAVTPMLDDGVAPDEVATDGIYTAVATVAAATTSGTKSLPVLVSDGGGNAGGSFIDIEVRPSATPDNDNCSTASAILGPFPATAMADLTGATVESNPIATSLGLPITGMTARRGIWYTVVGTGNTMTASLCGTSPDTFDSVLFVLCGTCDGLTIVANDDDSCVTLASPPFDTSTVTWCSASGTTYYIWAAPFASGASTQVLTLTVSDGAPCTNAFPCTICLGTSGPFTEIEPGYGIHTNDGCSSTPNKFTNIATPSFPGTLVRGTARGMIGNRDVDWYRFQATTTDTMTVKLDALGSQAQAQVFSLSPGGVCPPSPATPLFFTPILLTRCPTGIQSISGPVTAGTWYAVLVVGGISLQSTPAGTIFGGQMPGGTTFQYRMNIAIGDRPADSTPFCFGDGTQAACPCGNSGAIGHGCENSAGTGGAQLSAAGTTDVANDTLVLTSSGELPSVISIFFQGEASLSPSSFGDGIRCAGGDRLRLYLKVSSPSGVVSAPEAGDPSITARCAFLGAPIAAGDIRYYQVCYRDPDPGFCPLPTGRNYNASNGQIIVW